MAAAAGTLAARARLRALVRLPRRRDAPVRADARTTTTTSVQPPRHVRGRLPPQRGPRRPRDRVPRRPARRRRRPAVLPLLRDRRVPLAAPRAAGVDRALPRPVRRRAGTRGASATFARQLAAGLAARRAPSCRRGRRGCRRGTTLEPEDQAVAARFMECFAAFLSHTDAQIGRVLAFLERARRARQHARRARLRQRRERRGRRDAARSTTCASWNGDAGRARGAARRASTSSAGPTAHNNYPWGWTMAGNTPFRRWKREVHEGGVADPCIVHWPRGIAAPAARSAASSCTRSTCCPTVLELVGVDAPDDDRRRRAAPDRGHELRVRCSHDAGRARAPRHAVLRDARLAAASTTTGWKAVTFKPLGADVRRRPRPRRAVRRRRVGAVPRRRGLLGERTTSPTQEPERLARAGRAVVGRGARATTCCRSTTAPRTRSSTRARADLRRADRYVYRPDGAPVPESVAVERAQPLAHDHRRRSTCPRASRPNGVLLAIGLRARRLLVPPARRAAALRAQPLRQGALRRSTSDAVDRAGRAHARVRASRRPTTSAGTGELLRRRRGRRRGRDPDVHADALQRHRRRAHLRLRARARRSATATRRRSGSPATIRRVVVEVTGEPRPRSAGRVRGDHGGAVAGAYRDPPLGTRHEWRSTSPPGPTRHSPRHTGGGHCSSSASLSS